MKKFLFRLRDKKGSAMTFGILIFIVLLMVSGALFTYSELRITTANLRNTAQRVLDTCTVTEGQRAVESFKNGTDYSPSLDANLFTARLQSALGIGNDLIGYQDGREKFQLSDVTMSCTGTDAIKTVIRFKIHEPMYFSGKEINALDVTVTLYSQYSTK